MQVKYISWYMTAPKTAKYLLVRKIFDHGEQNVKLLHFVTPKDFEVVKGFSDVCYSNRESFSNMLFECEEIVKKDTLWIEKPTWMYADDTIDDFSL